MDIDKVHASNLKNKWNKVSNVKEKRKKLNDRKSSFYMIFLTTSKSAKIN